MKENRTNEAEVLLNRLVELHDGWVAHGCEPLEVMKLTAAMMAVLTQRVFPRNPTQNDLLELPTRLLNCNMVWEKFVSGHKDVLFYTPDLWRKWVWGLYREHPATRADLWRCLHWESITIDDNNNNTPNTDGNDDTKN